MINAIQRYTSSHFIRVMIVISILYFLIELFQISYQRIECDEFWFAHHIVQYLYNLPYRDFLPYKSPFGYYLLAPPFLLMPHVFYTLWLTKLEIVILDTIFIYCTGVMLRRFYQPVIVCVTLCVLVFNQSFLIYSGVLRPDILSCWFSLFAIMFIFNNRILYAAIFSAVAFLISQKAACYIVACNLAMAVALLSPGYRLSTIRHVFLFNTIIVIITFIYLGAWAAISSWHVVIDSFFYEAYILATLDYYSPALYYGWQVVLAKVGWLFLFWPLIGLSFLNVPLHNHLHKLRVTVFATTVFVFVFLYKQPFSYNMALAFPAFFVIYPELFSWIFDVLKTTSTHNTMTVSQKRVIFWYVSLYTIIISSIGIVFGLPQLIFLIAAAISLGVDLYFYPIKQQWFSSLIIVSIAMFAFILPVSAYYYTLAELDGSYQRKNIQFASQLLSNNEGYVAGTPFIFNRSQPISGLRNLITPSIEYLYDPSDRLVPILNKSLELEATTPDKIIQQLESTPVKLYINNYRIHYLPSSIRDYLDSHFRHYSGSVYLYSPIIQAGSSQFNLSFSGRYAVDCNPQRVGHACSSGSRVEIDQRSYTIGSIVALPAGAHLSHADTTYSLNFIPENVDLSDESKIDKYTEMHKYVYM